ncbi:putative lysophospholipase BODYGUARD 3 [Asimina triloba]
MTQIRTFLIDGFFCHTHYAAWHTLHNIIYGSASKMDGYLDAVREKLKCQVTMFHGRDDELLPVECSYAVQSKIPRAQVKVIEKKDHITLVVGRQKAFARELEEIWNKMS